MLLNAYFSQQTSISSLAQEHLPAISVLGDIESELEALVRAGNDDEYFSKSSLFWTMYGRQNNVL